MDESWTTEKTEMAAELLGMSATALRAAFNTKAKGMPVVYMFELGTVKQLRKSFPTEIPETFKDTDLVFKYGLTEDFKVRTGQHEKNFKKFEYDDGTPLQLKLRHHVYIDPAFLGKAEMDMEKYFKCAKWHLQLKHKLLTEVVAIPEHFVDNMVHSEFKRVGMAYAGRLQEQQMINEQLKVQIEKDRASQAELRTAHAEAMQSNKLLLDEKDIRLREKDEMMQTYKVMIQKFNMM
jgi:hypothetical protein